MPDNEAARVGRHVERRNGEGNNNTHLQVALTSIAWTPRGSLEAMKATSASWPKDSNKSASSSTAGNKQREVSNFAGVGSRAVRSRTQQLQAPGHAAVPEQVLAQRLCYASRGGHKHVRRGGGCSRQRRLRCPRARQLRNTHDAAGSCCERNSLVADLRACQDRVSASDRRLFVSDNATQTTKLPNHAPAGTAPGLAPAPGPVALGCCAAVWWSAACGGRAGGRPAFCQSRWRLGR
jgi:hypothetical protein